MEKQKSFEKEVKQELSTINQQLSTYKTILEELVDKEQDKISSIQIAWWIVGIVGLLAFLSWLPTILTTYYPVWKTFLIFLIATSLAGIWYYVNKNLSNYYDELCKLSSKLYEGGFRL